MSCTVRVNRHGYLAFRLYWNRVESHEGTKLKDTPENRAKVEARAFVISQEMADGAFDYLRWFPDGNMARRFRAEAQPAHDRTITVSAFFRRWGRAEGETTGGDADRKQVRPVSVKWALNRASYIAVHVLPVLGTKCLDELTTADLTELQQRLIAKALKPATIDRVIHSALRGMLRDAKASGYRIPDLRALFERQFIQRLDQGRDAHEIDPFTEAERDRILSGFREKRAHFYPFVCFQFWTGARPSEAIALRWGCLDLAGRRAQIRLSRVLGRDGRPKTGKSKRDVVIHGVLLDVLRDSRPLHPTPDGFVFTTPTGAPIDEANFYRREWIPMLRRLNIRPRPLYNARHTYISFMLAIGVNPLFVARQTGTSLAMIQEHYGSARLPADELDEMIQSRNPAGTLARTPRSKGSDTTPKVAAVQCVRAKSGRPGSNRRRPAWEAGILPLNYARTGGFVQRPGR